MRFFARFHSYSGGHGGDIFRSSNYISYDAQGNVHYHLIPLLFLAFIVLFVAFYFWSQGRREQIQAWANQPLTWRFFAWSGTIIGLIALAGFVLTRFPQFVWL